LRHEPGEPKWDVGIGEEKKPKSLPGSCEHYKLKTVPARRRGPKWFIITCVGYRLGCYAGYCNSKNIMRNGNRLTARSIPVVAVEIWFRFLRWALGLTRYPLIRGTYNVVIKPNDKIITMIQFSIIFRSFELSYDYNYLYY